MKKEKTVKESRTTMTQMVMPNDTNPIGNLMGGNLMRWMDIAAGICAAKHCEAYVVTASVDHVSFQSPIKLGEVITLKACATKAFNTSLEIFVEVMAESFKGGNLRKSNHAYFTFVALDEQSNQPTSIPKITPLSNAEKDLYEGATRRRELRLILSGRLKPNEAKEIKKIFGEV